MAAVGYVLTQQDLANRIGVIRQTVNAIEAGKYAPSLDVAFRIANVFEVRIEDVFTTPVPSHRLRVPPTLALVGRCFLRDVPLTEPPRPFPRPGNGR